MARPQGKPKAYQLDALTAMVDWLARCYRTDGERVQRSFPQIVRALEHAGVQTREGADEWARTGTVKGDRQRFRKTLEMRLNTLVELGFLVSWEPVYGADGQSGGIVLVLTADVAQLAKAPAIRRRRGAHHEGPATSGVSTSRALRRASISTTTTPPPTGINDVSSAWKAADKHESSGGRERGSDRDANERELVERARAALTARQLLPGGQVSAAETLAALPWLRLVPVVALARILLGLYRPEITPKLSARSQRRLEAAVPRLDRYANFGAGGEGVGLELLIAACINPEPPWRGAGPARSLGAIAKQLDGLSKKWRRAHKRGHRHNGASNDRGAA